MVLYITGALLRTPAIKTWQNTDTYTE